MAFNFQNLDGETRRHMLAEVDHDIANNRLYKSARFNEHGNTNYQAILTEIIQGGSEVTLATHLRDRNCFKTEETRNVKGKTITAKVPSNAAETFAEGEFNRLYIRAICLRAILENQRIHVYRARESSNPRQESVELIGQEIDPERLLTDLRTNNFVDNALGLPPGPNSGLSVRFITA